MTTAFILTAIALGGSLAVCLRLWEKLDKANLRAANWETACKCQGESLEAVYKQIAAAGKEIDRRSGVLM